MSLGRRHACSILSQPDAIMDDAYSVFLTCEWRKALCRGEDIQSLVCYDEPGFGLVSRITRITTVR